MFKGMTWQGLVLTLIAAALLAFVATVVIAAIVYALPISDKAKCITLFTLGLCSISIGYFTLIKMPANNQQAAPQAIKTITGVIDRCRLARDIKRNLSHVPTMPNRAIAISKEPNKIQPKITKALAYIASSLRRIRSR